MKIKPIWVESEDVSVTDGVVHTRRKGALWVCMGDTSAQVERHWRGFWEYAQKTLDKKVGIYSPAVLRYAAHQVFKQQREWEKEHQVQTADGKDKKVQTALRKAWGPATGLYLYHFPLQSADIPVLYQRYRQQCEQQQTLNGQKVPRLIQGTFNDGQLRMSESMQLTGSTKHLEHVLACLQPLESLVQAALLERAVQKQRDKLAAKGSTSKRSEKRSQTGQLDPVPCKPTLRL